MLKLMMIIMMLCGSMMSVQAQSIGWGIPRSKDEIQPFPGNVYDELIRSNDAFYIGNPDEKIIYLTFDTGYEIGNTSVILDVLKKHDVPTTFFVTGHFVTEQADLVKRMATEGHIVGNHTWNHPNLTTVSKEKFVEELTSIEKAYTDITGQEMVKFLRPPEGCISQQMLDYAKEMGYYTIMWSLAYVDWEIDGQKGWEHPYHEILERVHPGAIILMHSVSKDNADALDQLIPKLREKGYEFKSIQHLLTSDMIEPIE